MQVDGRLEVEIALSDREEKPGSDKILRRSTDTSDEILGAWFSTKECQRKLEDSLVISIKLPIYHLQSQVPE